MFGSGPDLEYTFRIWRVLSPKTRAQNAYFRIFYNDIVNDLSLSANVLRKKCHIDKRKRFIKFEGSLIFSPNLGNFVPQIVFAHLNKQLAVTANRRLFILKTCQL